ncbi:hypothetical protein [Amycolatopsis sp. cmx-4-68]|uniref:hypothetical protein n=1 Tax=Amycolatopsis sp. cmx-4-68 TaxID=2790938 RepID=UPI00397E4616
MADAAGDLFKEVVQVGAVPAVGLLDVGAGGGCGPVVGDQDAGERDDLGIEDGAAA